MKRFFLISLALGLSFVLGSKLTFHFLVPKAPPALDERLEEVIPAKMPGWRSEDVPLSNTPEGEQRVLSLLDLDDVFCREYTRGDTTVVVYIAYWSPGSEPYSSVAIHNPDSCWSIAGWEIEDRESNRDRTMAGIHLKEHEWGVYSKDGNEAHVIFWHLLGGQPNKYIKHMLWTSTGLDSIKRQFYFILNIAQLGLELGRDQLFIRISSNKSFDELEKSGELRQVLEHLEGLGLAKPEPATMPEPAAMPEPATMPEPVAMPEPMAMRSEGVARRYGSAWV